MIDFLSQPPQDTEDEAPTRIFPQEDGNASYTAFMKAFIERLADLAPTTLESHEDTAILTEQFLLQRNDSSSSADVVDRTGISVDRLQPSEDCIPGVLEDLPVSHQFVLLNNQSIGEYSFRKGAPSALCAMPSGPGPVSVAHRMNQTIVAPQKAYFFELERGDAFCGRALTGVQQTSEEFMRLPPHFMKSTPDVIATMKTLVPNFGKPSACGCFRQLLTS